MESHSTLSEVLSHFLHWKIEEIALVQWNDQVQGDVEQEEQMKNTVWSQLAGDSKHKHRPELARDFLSVLLLLLSCFYDIANSLLFQILMY